VRSDVIIFNSRFYLEFLTSLVEYLIQNKTYEDYKTYENKLFPGRLNDGKNVKIIMVHRLFTYLETL